MMFRSFIFALVILALLLAGCAGPERDRRPDTGQPPPEQPERAEQLREQNYVDVFAYGDDDWRETWQAQLTPIARFDISKGRKHTRNGDAEAGGQMVQGFRVQLADVLKHAEAMRIRDRALGVFDHVYVTFRSPNYKIRAGNFQRRTDAERALHDARGLGFRDAWIVPDWVYLNPALPIEESDELAADTLNSSSTAAPTDTVSLPSTD